MAYGFIHMDNWSCWETGVGQVGGQFEITGQPPLSSYPISVPESCFSSASAFNHLSAFVLRLEPALVCRIRRPSLSISQLSPSSPRMYTTLHVTNFRSTLRCLDILLYNYLIPNRRHGVSDIEAYHTKKFASCRRPFSAAWHKTCWPVTNLRQIIYAPSDSAATGRISF